MIYVQVMKVQKSIYLISQIKFLKQMFDNLI